MTLEFWKWTPRIMRTQLTKLRAQSLAAGRSQAWTMYVRQS
jgi:hypothetical protein